MAASRIHLTNGESFTERLQLLFPNATILTWNEILCEGPAGQKVFSESFIDERIQFLGAFEPTAPAKYTAFVDQFRVFEENQIDTVVLWFEYDLFCHINLAAAVSYLATEYPNVSLELVCSGYLPEMEGLYGLSELSEDALSREYENRLILNDSDRTALMEFWMQYTSKDHSKLKDLAFSQDRLPYLTDCIAAHMKRFPFQENGLNALESLLLHSIRENKFESVPKLVGHLLRNQGFYGFGDLQWFALAEKLSGCYTENGILQLTEKGHQVLEGIDNAQDFLMDATLFGRCAKYDYLYNPSKQAIEKR